MGICLPRWDKHAAGSSVMTRSDEGLWLDFAAVRRTESSVGRLSPNLFGLYDMYGNASQLTVSPQDQPVDRGGDAGVSARRARSATRFSAIIRMRRTFVAGFRVAMQCKSCLQATQR